MTIFLDRIDTPALSNSEFTFEFSQFLSVLVDTLNEDIFDIENAFNFLTAPNYTAAQISTMFTDGVLSNGIVLYDTTNNEYVGMQSGVLVKFSTTAYP